MLVLSRRRGESLIIAGRIEVTVLSVKGDRVRIGVTAPSHMPVVRAELLHMDKDVEGEPDAAQAGVAPHCCG